MRYVALANYTKPGDPGREGIDASEGKSKPGRLGAAPMSATTQSRFGTGIEIVGQRECKKMGWNKMQGSLTVITRESAVELGGEGITINITIKRDATQQGDSKGRRRNPELQLSAATHTACPQPNPRRREHGDIDRVWVLG
jgi:hypothetical protein